MSPAGDATIRRRRRSTSRWRRTSELVAAVDRADAMRPLSTAAERAHPAALSKRSILEGGLMAKGRGEKNVKRFDQSKKKQLLRLHYLS